MVLFYVQFYVSFCEHKIVMILQVTALSGESFPLILLNIGLSRKITKKTHSLFSHPKQLFLHIKQVSFALCCA